MDMLLAFLNSIHPLSDECVNHLTTILKERTIKKKEFLLKAGHVSRDVCFITKGLLRCYYSNENKEVCSWFMMEGDMIFSINSFYEQAKSYENIQALEDCTVYYIGHNELDILYRQFPELERSGRLLTIKYHKLWDQQLYSFRMHTPAERYQWLFLNFPEVILRVPVKDIASYLAISRYTLSRIRSRLNKVLYRNSTRA